MSAGLEASLVYILLFRLPVIVAEGRLLVDVADVYASSSVVNDGLIGYLPGTS